MAAMGPNGWGLMRGSEHCPLGAVLRGYKTHVAERIETTQVWVKWLPPLTQASPDFSAVWMVASHLWASGASPLLLKLGMRSCT